MTYRKFVPGVPVRVPVADDTGNTIFTPVDSDFVPNVPDVPVKSRDTYTESVLCVCEEELTHTHTQSACKKGSHVSGNGNTGTFSKLQVVERVPAGVWEREQKREQKREQRPPLPQDLWQTGIATLAEARDVQRTLSCDYVTACGKGEDGLWYVACPSSGLTAKAVPASCQPNGVTTVDDTV